MIKGQRSVASLRRELEITRERIARLLRDLEAAYCTAGGQAGASLYQREPHGPADPDACGACRGTGTKDAPK